MPWWQRLLLTVVAVLAVSLVATLAWQAGFGGRLPGYASGVIGGLAAIPVWEFLRRIRADSDAS